MEIDFLGLSSKEPQAVVKEEVHTGGYKEIGLIEGPVTQWPFTNKVSALPHFMSFKAAQLDKTKKIASDAQISLAFMTTSTADADNPDQLGSGAENQNLAETKPQSMEGVPVTTMLSIVPRIGSVNGFTELRAKAFNSPAQLTIFYAGTVNVFDGISPEKAQAIMLLAGNEVSMGQPKIQVQAPISTPAAGDGVPVNHPMNAVPNSDLASPMSFSSHTGAQSGSGSTTNEEIKPAKITGVATPPVSVLERPKALKAMGSVPATTMIASAVPQFRKASLARFLEKRKERVLNTAPYKFASKSPDQLAMNP
ncbi:protein TIFY 6B-like isoform X2 [Tripterygium wilfordii]|uniref:protein TIFY 6B-like isoform X2 n=1 Tax=Tripterygium wilfordii TaxID=458696 RepID=UPI0018F805BB|nr:protein TIFY 6B-like isoform X2 [Tripterygium wilfordii]